MPGREQRTVFGEVAGDYDAVRPGYPEALVDDVLAFAGGGSPRTLEIGAGTGRATVAFAARGVPIVALEPSPAMAALARRRCDGLGGVSIVESTFEDWPLAHGVGLLISAQAWHWVDPLVGYEKARRALDRGGALALFWNRPSTPDTDLWRRIDRAYARHAPELTPAASAGAKARMGELTATELARSGHFTGVEERTYPFSQTYSASDYLRLLSTHSSHRMLPADRRARLHGAIGELIEADGGEIHVDYATRLFLARPTNTASAS